MQCRKVKQFLSTYVSNDLDENEASGVREHLQSCDDCFDEYNSLTRMFDVMKTIPIPGPAPSFWVMLPNRIRHLLEESQVEMVKHSVRRWFIGYVEQWRPLLLGVALTSVIFLCIPVFTKSLDVVESGTSLVAISPSNTDAFVNSGNIDVNWHSKEMANILNKIGADHELATELKTIRGETSIHEARLIEQKGALLRNIHTYQSETNRGANLDEAIAELGKTEKELLQLKSEEAKQISKLLDEKVIGRLVIEWDALRRNKKLNQNESSSVQQQKKGGK